MNILDEIVSKKRKRVDEVKSQASIEDIQNQLAKTPSLKRRLLSLSNSLIISQERIM